MSTNTYDEEIARYKWVCIAVAVIALAGALGAVGVAWAEAWAKVHTKEVAKP